ncbi:hypothetical protein C7T35_22735 [Variovorax sp. WS11]|uniref:hypothetical protein n=1 Tax=Variovorax sp. WS11 TaxID=1105204 RepID=UPI000D0D1EBE|nr:hypothetical protein [Variovorax sp. WS11]NDZ11780.1 hypothetical protein [Variovorax sp. WS11]PSL82325.1 hypothetical protein C7T35_22735 [Variovorax sp. WS11]
MTMHKGFVPLRRMPSGVLAQTTPLSDAKQCERAVLAIWRSLDEHVLANTEVRDELASILEPLTALPLGGRPQLLIKALRLPDPLDASDLYWLTRRLLTLVPELQAVAVARGEPGANEAHSLDWTSFFRKP